MTYKPEPKVLDIEVFPDGFASMHWTNLFRFTYDLEHVNSSNSPHVRVKNTLGAVKSGGGYGLPNGTYKMTFESASRWDVTKTNTISNLKNASLSNFTGSGSITVLHDRQVECYDTGRTVATGYNILYFKVTHYITVSGVGSGQAGPQPQYYASSSITSGFSMNPFFQYKRRFIAELIEDVTI